MDKLDKLATESVNLNTLNLDDLEVEDILRKINEEDKKVAYAVEEVIPEITKAVKSLKERWDKGGRIIYIGAGTSGRLGVLDAAENPSTFGTDPSRVIGILAGGDIGMKQPVKGVEDSFKQGYNDIEGINLTENDCVIGIAASGRTPYVMGAFEKAEESGAFKIGIACNKAAKFKDIVDVAILPEPGPEPIMGSTRMKAGTSQKLVLNMMSTTLMILSGKVYKNLMVDMKQVNEKLKDRAERIVAIACDISTEEARELLIRAEGNVKIAILLNKGLSEKDAKEKLDRNDGHIRRIIKNL
ncbi:N-acetylmuramic acid 6-phosphate etherase [Sporosalibacterium faouarense]|uniref:N-acetylmuramic acid 6-phosphate etherase n=1 Tax=Sporosalibacterium faouarense TaxID=516123 RepID=UPI00192AD6DF|nr:N-acetylmuramic acid 6-phosphate etherase [Sporosalibacterium faouarense]